MNGIKYQLGDIIYMDKESCPTQRFWTSYPSHDRPSCLITSSTRQQKASDSPTLNEIQHDIDMDQYMAILGLREVPAGAFDRHYWFCARVRPKEWHFEDDLWCNIAKDTTIWCRKVDKDHGAGAGRSASVEPGKRPPQGSAANRSKSTGTTQRWVKTAKYLVSENRTEGGFLYHLFTGYHLLRNIVVQNVPTSAIRDMLHDMRTQKRQEYEEKRISKLGNCTDIKHYKMCANWALNRCQWGDGCCFEHHYFDNPRPPIRGTQVCTHAMLGTECRNGDQCTFVHKDADSVDIMATLIPFLRTSDSKNIHQDDLWDIIRKEPVTLPPSKIEDWQKQQELEFDRCDERYRRHILVSGTEQEENVKGSPGGAPSGGKGSSGDGKPSGEGDGEQPNPTGNADSGGDDGDRKKEDQGGTGVHLLSKIAAQWPSKPWRPTAQAYPIQIYAYTGCENRDTAYDDGHDNFVLYKQLMKTFVLPCPVNEDRDNINMAHIRASNISEATQKLRVLDIAATRSMQCRDKKFIREPVGRDTVRDCELLTWCMALIHALQRYMNSQNSDNKERCRLVIECIDKNSHAADPTGQVRYLSPRFEDDEDWDTVVTGGRTTQHIRFTARTIRFKRVTGKGLTEVEGLDVVYDGWEEQEDEDTCLDRFRPTNRCVPLLFYMAYAAINYSLHITMELFWRTGLVWIPNRRLFWGTIDTRIAFFFKANHKTYDTFRTDISELEQRGIAKFRQLPYGWSREQFNYWLHNRRSQKSPESDLPTLPWFDSPREFDMAMSSGVDATLPIALENRHPPLFRTMIEKDMGATQTTHTVRYDWTQACRAFGRPYKSFLQSIHVITEDDSDDEMEGGNALASPPPAETDAAAAADAPMVAADAAASPAAAAASASSEGLGVGNSFAQAVDIVGDNVTRDDAHEHLLRGTPSHTTKFRFSSGYRDNPATFAIKQVARITRYFELIPNGQSYKAYDRSHKKVMWTTSKHDYRWMALLFCVPPTTAKEFMKEICGEDPNITIQELTKHLPKPIDPCHHSTQDVRLADNPTQGPDPRQDASHRRSRSPLRQDKTQPKAQLQARRPSRDRDPDQHWWTNAQWRGKEDDKWHEGQVGTKSQHYDWYNYRSHGASGSGVHPPPPPAAWGATDVRLIEQRQWDRQDGIDFTCGDELAPPAWFDVQRVRDQTNTWGVRYTQPTVRCRHCTVQCKHGQNCNVSHNVNTVCVRWHYSGKAPYFCNRQEQTLLCPHRNNPLAPCNTNPDWYCHNSHDESTNYEEAHLGGRR